MRDDSRFEIERAFDLLPHVVGCSWATTWFRFNEIKNPSKQEYREKVVEYFEKLEPLFTSHTGDNLVELNKYIQEKRQKAIKSIINGINPEVEKRFVRYLEYG